jgi:radial spoke head protein 4/6
VLALRNPHWPGWATVSSAKEFASIYIGYGLKASQLPFHPVSPEDIGVEADDVDECHEPNPKDPPDELEPDSDDENKKPEE